MEITLFNTIKISELAKGFTDTDETGCIAYGGKLNVRPKYQREFVYDDIKRRKVVESVIKGRPLNVMYFSKNSDGTYEVIDGQQRIISICQFINNMFSIKLNGNDMKFSNIKSTDPLLATKISEYKPLIYLCEGTDAEKLEWFETINIAGEVLTPQELRNAVYTGSWLSDAKTYFSKTNCAAYILAGQKKSNTYYISKSPIRQEFLETAIYWASSFDHLNDTEKLNKDTLIKRYMSDHQNDNNAKVLKAHFEKVISWIKKNFTVCRPAMSTIEWGELYNKFYKNTYNAADLEEKISELMEDEDVQNKKGIYPYVLEYFGKNDDGTKMTVKENHLNLRTFKENIISEVYEEQTNNANLERVSNCPLCAKAGSNKIFRLDEMDADHIIPWSKGGKTTKENCQLLCQYHNRSKSNK